MKKQTVSFQFDTTPAPFRPLRPTDAAAGVLLLAGIWGLLWQCLRPEPMLGLLGLGALAALGLAAGLLLKTQNDIASVAQAVGYESHSRFTAAFKEAYGELPTEYRRRHVCGAKKQACGTCTCSTCMRR